MIIEWAVVALCAARLTRLITTDDFPPIQWVRDRLLARWPNEDVTFGDSEVEAKGVTDTLGHPIGQLKRSGRDVFHIGDAWHATEPYRWSEVLTCNWCAGFWVSLVLVAVFWYQPASWWIMAPFAVNQLAAWFNE